MPNEFILLKTGNGILPGFITTVEPLYSGHPWDTTKSLLFGGGLLIEIVNNNGKITCAQEASHMPKSIWPWQVRSLAKAPATNGPRMSEATMCTKPCGLQPLVKR